MDKTRYFYMLMQNNTVVGLFKDYYKAQKAQLKKENNDDGRGCKILKIETDLIEGVLQKD